MKLRKQSIEKALKIALFICLALSLIPVILQMGFVKGDDATNITTTVNITSARPDILYIIPEANQSINLAQGTTYRVTCNITVRDFDGFDDIRYVNASFFLATNQTLTSADNVNSMYRNTSCTINSSSTTTTGTFLCSFNVYYFAFNGSWNCTAFTGDYSGFEMNMSNATPVRALYAMNMTNLIDFGNLSVNDYSLNQTLNVTNFGNQRINLSVFAYGGDDEARGQNWALVCENGSNISLTYERYSIDNGSSWSMMRPVTNAAATLTNFTVVKQNVVGNYITNATVWTLFVPPGSFGKCNGTLVFEALYSRLD